MMGLPILSYWTSGVTGMGIGMGSGFGAQPASTPAMIRIPASFSFISLISLWGPEKMLDVNALDSND